MLRLAAMPQALRILRKSRLIKVTILFLLFCFALAHVLFLTS